MCQEVSTGMDSQSLKSFKLELPEIHCWVYVLFMQIAREKDSGYSGVLESLREDIQSLGLVDGDDVESQKQGFEELHRRLDECSTNPAFTFLWDETEAIVPFTFTEERIASVKSPFVSNKAAI